jgi:hypothetical protein
MFALNNDPYVTMSFNAFTIKLAEVANPEQESFALMDNASFHHLYEITKEALAAKKLNVTRTAPSTCFLDPIEEYFAIVQQLFQKKLYTKIVRNGKLVPVSRQQVKGMIIASVYEAGECSSTELVCFLCNNIRRKRMVSNHESASDFPSIISPTGRHEKGALVIFQPKIHSGSSHPPRRTQTSFHREFLASYSV